MQWPFPGKHLNEDINDVPIGYLTWAATSSKNPEAKALAQQALDFRDKAGGATIPGTQPQTTQPRTNLGTLPGTSLPVDNSVYTVRALILLAAISAGKKNFWMLIPTFRKFVATGKAPMLPEMLDEQPPIQAPEQPQASMNQSTGQAPAEQNPFLSELSDDEIPF